MRRIKSALFLIMVPVMFSWTSATAKVEVVEFEDPDKQALYQDMIKELRCLVCQNQNLADSNAELAVDLRKRTRELVEDGRDRKEIVEYMVARYGDFVLYRPRFNSATAFLWTSPIVLLIVAIAWILRWRRRAVVTSTGYSDEELSRARKLLQQESSTDR